MSGFGSTACGSSPYGLATPVTAPQFEGSILRDEFSGETRGSRRIDSYTKDYVLDANGRILGMNDTQQLVLLAVSTTKGSAAMRDLGQALSRIERITSNTESLIRSELHSALQSLIDAGRIEFQGIDVDFVRPGVVHVHVLWRDVSTGVLQATAVG